MNLAQKVLSMISEGSYGKFEAAQCGSRFDLQKVLAAAEEIKSKDPYDLGYTGFAIGRNWANCEIDGTDVNVEVPGGLFAELMHCELNKRFKGIEFKGIGQYKPTGNLKERK